jgi:hypothetical protein
MLPLGAKASAFNLSKPFGTRLNRKFSFGGESAVVEEVRLPYALLRCGVRRMIRASIGRVTRRFAEQLMRVHSVFLGVSGALSIIHSARLLASAIAALSVSKMTDRSRGVHAWL